MPKGLRSFLKMLPLTFITPLFVGCASSSIALYHPETAKPASEIPLNRVEKVEIYRSARPSYSFTEIGLISFKSANLALEEVYSQLRKDSAPYGADAVLDVKIKRETHPVTESVEKCEPVTLCSADGNCENRQECRSELVTRMESSFTFVGSMVRKN